MKHMLIVIVCLLTLLALVLPVGATPPNPLTSPLPTPDQHAYGTPVVVGVTPPDPLTSPLPTPDQHAYSAPEIGDAVIATEARPLLPETGGALRGILYAVLLFAVVFCIELAGEIIRNCKGKRRDDDYTEVE